MKLKKHIPALLIFVVIIWGFIGLTFILDSKPVDVVKLKAIDGYGDSWEGTAFFVEDNLLVTAGHCVDGAESITLVTVDGIEIEADNWYLEDTGIADIGIIEVNTPTVEKRAAFDDAKVGETVIAIGNPLCYFPVVTQGIISAVNVVDDFTYGKNVFITDCPIVPGNSGCPIIDKNNNVLGVCSWAYVCEGMNFCVRSEVVIAVLSKYKAIKYLEGLD